MKKRILALFVAVALVFTAGTVPAFAAETGQREITAEKENAVFGAVAPNVTSHTQAEIRAYIESHGGTGDTARTYAVTPSTTAPYAAGQLSATTLNNALNRVNQMRYIAGLSEVSLNSTYSQKAQAGTLVNAVNGVMSHNPSQPSDMDDDLYSLGYSGCSSSNLYWSSWIGSVEDAITGWMDDSDSSNISRLGHRRWLINPSMGQIGFGATNGYQAAYVFDKSNSSASQSRVAWPAQNMPVEYFDADQAWSVSLGTSVDASSVNVKLTRRSDGKVWNFYSGCTDGDFYVDNGWYGAVGCIIFRPASGIIGYYDGNIYDVSITGLDTPIQYTVSFFAVGEAEPEPESGIITVSDWNNLESQHNYPDNVDVTKVYTASGSNVKSLSVTFSSNTEVENGYDHIYIYDGSDNLIGSYTGTALAGKTVEVPGKTVKIKLTSDQSNTAWGFKVSKLVVNADNSAPSSVTGLKIGGRAADALRLNWSKNTSADGYIIEQYKSGAWTRIARIASNATVTYRVEKLSAATTYQFRIKAFKLNGTAASYSGYQYINGKTNPSAVTGLKIGGTAKDALRLNWTKNSGASGYIIEQYKNGAWVRIARIADNSTVTYRVEKLSASTTYQFRVQAFAFDGSTPLYSTYQTISGKTNAPLATPTGVKIGGRATDALRLNWSKDSSASGYIIEQYKNGAWTRIARLEGNSTLTYRVEKLSASTTYQFRIKSFAFNGNTPVYSEYRNISGTTLPTAVTGLKIGGTAKDALRLNWNMNSKASGYIIEQYKNGAWVRIARIGSNSTVTYRVENLQSATTYQFRVQAFGFDGSTPLYSTYQYVNGTTSK